MKAKRKPADTALIIMLLTMVLALFISAIGGLLIFMSGVIRTTTEQQCRAYAARGHEGELTKERVAYLKEKYGPDYINDFPWYEACINNINNPVAK